MIRPTLLYRNNTFVENETLTIANGRIASEEQVAHTAAPTTTLKNKALLPGFVNVHSHAFQRLIRGKAESRATSGKDFWSWRGTMYHAAANLTPEDVYDVARMAFLEMLLSATTTVGEFHYLHTAPNGQPYDDPNELAHQVIAAAQSVGIRIVLLNSAYLRAGFQLPPDPGQRRFYETTDSFLKNTESLLAAYPGSNEVTIGVAPHSVRAVPLPALKEVLHWARAQALPIHMHLAEQLAENTASLREHTLTPIALLAKHSLLAPDLTAVHAIHISPEEIAALAAARSNICSCPTTERNLGDGILPADRILEANIPIALGSDSQAQIDPLEDARELDYHLRLQHQQRAILDQIDSTSIATTLFNTATRNGARALQLPTGSLTPGEYADYITVDTHDPSIAGHTPDSLLPLLTFGLNRTAIRDVAVNGKIIVTDGHHPLAEEIIARYTQLHRRIWSDAPPSPSNR
jgi:formimidoylglutamate deiminase